MLHPVACLRIPKVHKSQIDATALDKVILSTFSLEEEAALLSDLKLSLTDPITFDLRNHWVQVDERVDSVFLPNFTALIPSWVVLLVKLPIPEEAVAFRKRA
jgi:hypothetical protein